jgi:hypothetical protein
MGADRDITASETTESANSALREPEPLLLRAPRSRFGRFAQL